MTTPAGEVLIVGEAGVGKQSLVNRLLNSKAADRKTPLKQQQQWDLDTKYYTAQVLVECQLPTEQAAPAAATCGGLVLVFAADQKSSFHAVRDWVEHLPSDVADVRLCIANKIDKLVRPDCPQQVQRSTLLAEAVQWCADSLFEYIEVSSSDAEVDQQLVWEEQQQGVSRVKEALEAHMWPGLKMKPKQMQQGKQALPAAGNTSSNHQQPNDDHDFQLNETQTSSGSESDSQDHKIFQNAEEAGFDQLDKMFDDLRSRPYLCPIPCLCKQASVSAIDCCHLESVLLVMIKTCL